MNIWHLDHQHMLARPTRPAPNPPTLPCPPQPTHPTQPAPNYLDGKGAHPACTSVDQHPLAILHSGQIQRLQKGWVGLGRVGLGA